MKDLTCTSLSAIEHILSYRPDRIRKIQVHARSKDHSARLEKIEKLAKDNSIHLEPARGPEGVTASAILAPFEYGNLDSFLQSAKTQKRGIVVVLDHLQDTQNLGAICRSADAFGASAIILPKDRSVSVTSGVYDSSVGTVETVPILKVTNISEALRKLKDAEFWAVGTTFGAKSKPLEELPDFEKVALVMGSELSGLSPLVEKTVDYLVYIPMVGKVRSLNVSVASGILLHFLGHRLKTSHAPQD